MSLNAFVNIYKDMNSEKKKHYLYHIYVVTVHLLPFIHIIHVTFVLGIAELLKHPFGLLC